MAILRPAGTGAAALSPMIDVDTAPTNPTQLPFAFLERLKEMKIRTLEVCPEDPIWTIDCLAIWPGRVLTADQVSNRTLDRLNDAGVSLRLVPYDEVYLGGGIHCPTGPLIRDPI